MPKLKTQWLWPSLPSSSESHANSEQQRWLHDERKKVVEGAWTQKSDVALEEARRIFDAEQERRRGADTKAGFYLAAITTLMPILVAVFPGLWDEKVSKILEITLLGIFVCALIYLMRAGLWALRTIKVSTVSQLGAGDIAESFNSDSPEKKLAIKLLTSVISNYNDTNQKISCIKMTHEYLLRAFFCFVTFLVIQAVWPIAIWAIFQINNETVTQIMSCFQ